MIRKTLFTAVALLLLSVPCWGVTVNVGTPGGNLVSTTYYTKPGDSASGSVTGFGGSVSVTTSGNVHKGVIRAENGAGDYQFSPFTGSGFTASGTASSQGVGVAAESPNPGVDVFVVTQSGGLGASTVGGTPTPSYGTINAGVTAAGGDASTRPDWVLVDRGIYKESAAINGFEAGSQLTSVWGAGKTVVDYSAGSRTVINVNNSPGFVIDGFTIKANQNYSGITANSSPGLQIANNRIEGSGRGLDGISANNSEGAQVYRNEVSGFWSGIALDASANSLVKGNTVQDIDVDGIRLMRSANSMVEGNAVQDSGWRGIYLAYSANSVVEGNTVQDSGFEGIWLLYSPTSLVKGNTVQRACWGGGGWGGISLFNTWDYSANSIVEGNTVQNSRIGMYIFGHNNTVKGNTVQDSGDSGMIVGSGNNSIIEGNTVQDSGGSGMLVYSANSIVEGNMVQGSGKEGIYLQGSANSLVKGNTVTANVRGIVFDGNTTNSRVEKNNIYDNQNVGLWNNVNTTTNTVNNNWWGKRVPTYQGGLGVDRPGTLGMDIRDARDGANDLNPAPAPFAY